MTAIEKNRLRVKIFIGTPITLDIRMHLNKSSLWKQAQIGLSEDSFKEIHFGGKDYLGYHLQQEFVQIDSLKKLEFEIRKNLESFCPSFNADRIHVQIFPQIFIE